MSEVVTTARKHYTAVHSRAEYQKMFFDASPEGQSTIAALRETALPHEIAGEVEILLCNLPNISSPPAIRAFSVDRFREDYLADVEMAYERLQIGLVNHPLSGAVDTMMRAYFAFDRLYGQEACDAMKEKATEALSQIEMFLSKS